MVLTFLENRPLNATTHWPFWFYNATMDKAIWKTQLTPQTALIIVDTGKLLVALNNLRVYNSSLTARINNIVYDDNGAGNRSNYASLVPSVKDNAGSNSVYAYYCWSGFASFWPQQLRNIPSQIMTNIFNSPTITTYNVTLPDTPITCEPLLLSIFELK